MRHKISRHTHLGTEVALSVEAKVLQFMAYSFMATVLRTFPSVWSSSTISNVAQPGPSFTFVQLVSLVVDLVFEKLTMVTFSFKTRMVGALCIEANDGARSRLALCTSTLMLWGFFGDVWSPVPDDADSVRALGCDIFT
jgi:hypothetical protein